MQPAPALGLCVWATWIAVSDLRFRRIPNVLTLPAVVVAAGWMVASGRCLSGESWLSGVEAGGFALAVTLPAYALGKLGAGDAKLLLAIGLLCGWPVTSDTFMVGALLGALLALWWWATHHWVLPAMLPARWQRWASMWMSEAGNPSARLRLPFGTLLCIGLCAILLKDFA